jgi:hypothetical protein
MADDDSVNSRSETPALNQELTGLQEGLPPTGAEPVIPIDNDSSSNGEEFKDAQENETMGNNTAAPTSAPTAPTEPTAPTPPTAPATRRPATTSRGSSSVKKKKKLAQQCRKGSRIKVTRNNLMHCLLVEAQKLK